MADPVVCVKGLSKRYTLLHQTAERYATLRDVASNGFRKFFRPSIASTSREDFWALNNISFEVQAGERIGIVGRNGAGKSTLLKILSRITEPTGGQIRLRGRVASLLEVGTGFHPELSGRENIYLNGAILGMKRAEIAAKFDEIVAFAEIETFLDTPVKRYSSGMYVRLAFSVAAHLHSDILIVDEVLAVGDAEFQKRCLGRIESSSHEGRTVLIVSHQMDVIRRLATRGLLMDQGRVTMTGTPDDVVRAYLTAADSSTLERPAQEGPSFTRINLNQEKLSRGGLEVTLEFSSSEPITTPSFGLVVHGANGSPVCGSNTHMHPISCPVSRCNSGTVVFSLPGLPLLSGEYTLSFWLADGLTVLQHLPHALSFNFQDTSPPEYHIDHSIIGHTKITPVWTFE